MYKVLPALVRNRLGELGASSKDSSSETAKHKIPVRTHYQHRAAYSTRSRSTGSIEPLSHFGVSDSETSDWYQSSNDRETPVVQKQRKSIASTRPSSSDSCASLSSTSNDAVSCDNGGIRWKYANQGLSLLSMASHEAASPSGLDTAFTRQLYLHAVSYLLKGLPSDLTLEESMSVRVALPEDIVASVSTSQVAIAHTSPFPASLHAQRVGSQQPSTIQQTVAICVLYIFFVAAAIMPYVRLLGAAALKYERRHRLSERAVSKCARVVDKMGKRGVELGKEVWQWEALRWGIEEAAKGLRLGMEGGMGALVEGGRDERIVLL